MVVRGRRLTVGVLAAGLLVGGFFAIPVSKAFASGGDSFATLEAPFTQNLYGAVQVPNLLGGVAFAPNGDLLVDNCSVSGGPLYRFDHTTTLPTLNGTSTLHPYSTMPSDAGCGLTNHPNGSLYTNTTSGVVQLDVDTGVQEAGPFGAPGNALGIAVDPETGNLAYVQANGNIGYVNPTLSSTGTLSTVTTGFIDQITYDPSGNYLFISDDGGNALVILKRDGTLVQDIPLEFGSGPDGIAFHASQPQFVVTNDNDGTLTRFDFPNGDFTQSPSQSLMGSGGFRGDNAQVGSDGCLYATQNGTRYDDGTVDYGTNSLVQICPGFAPPPGVSKGVGRYVALGDSYSSGEGAIDLSGNPSFDPSTNLPKDDECHRSLNAYPNLLSTEPAVDAIKSGFVFAACSGARVANFVKTLPGDGGWNEGPQLDQISLSGSPSSRTGLITVSVGGNDVGFVPDLKACIHGLGRGQSGCSDQIKTRLANGLKLLTQGGRVLYNLQNMDDWTFCPRCDPSQVNVVNVPSLSSLYEDIHARAPLAKVIVLGYPELFPANAASSCVVGTFTNGLGMHVQYALNPSEMATMDQAETSLNSTIAKEVEIAHSQGVNIVFVPSYADFQGHGPCDTSPPSAIWVNGLMWQGRYIWDISVYSFHPNQAGQKEFERLVLPQV